MRDLIIPSIVFVAEDPTFDDEEEDDKHFASTSKVPRHGSAPNVKFEISIEHLFFPWQA